MDIRGWIARKLLNLANAIDPDCKIMCDAIRGWHFQRGWKQPVMGEYAAPSTTASSKEKE